MVVFKSKISSSCQPNSKNINSCTSMAENYFLGDPEDDSSDKHDSKHPEKVIG